MALDTNGNLVTVVLRMPPDLLDQIDSYRKESLFAPTRSAAIRGLVEAGLESEVVRTSPRRSRKKRVLPVS